MFNANKFYSQYNQPVAASYRKTIIEIERIARDAQQHRNDPEKGDYFKYCFQVASLIADMAELERNLLSKDYYNSHSFEQLHQENQKIFGELSADNYGRSYFNPSRCATLFGNGIGQVLSYLYLQYFRYYHYAVAHLIFKMEAYNRTFIKIYEHLTREAPDILTLKRIACEPEMNNIADTADSYIRQEFDADYTPWLDVALKADLSDMRYLFRYGRRISDTEIGMAKFLYSYPDAALRKLSRMMARAYIHGFHASNKDLSRKSTVLLSYCIGQEKLVRFLAVALKKSGLRIIVPKICSSKVNEQFDFDHRFDQALYLDQDYCALTRQGYADASERHSEKIRACSGLIFIEKFGRPPFKPQAKPQCLRFTGEQQQQYQKLRTDVAAIRERFCPHRETSFSIISMPDPEIGKNFSAIFNDILDVNMLDPSKYQKVQQLLIDVLDQADHVIINGSGSNLTDMTVRLQPLRDPARQSNFENCGADVNIPLGEVFTSPQLTGTHGVLHVGETFLNDLKFVDLRLTFVDGYIVDYCCANFDALQQNRKYIEENLLFPHATLPLGEFAVGTNTLAYIIAKKHGIISVLPPLIIEKMGPHFAIGDTCYSYSEDVPVFNPDKKEVIARSNEKTRLYQSDPDRAYTHVHIDITLPYDEIALIAAVAVDGTQTDIIRDGRFVLPGTALLNKPFK